jgi:hypothetical protein
MTFLMSPVVVTPILLWATWSSYSHDLRFGGGLYWVSAVLFALYVMSVQAHETLRRVTPLWLTVVSFIAEVGAFGIGLGCWVHTWLAQ